jgi:hypothetical protein
MKILSQFTADGVTTVQTAHLDEETGALIIAESNGKTRQEFIAEPTAAYELMLYLQSQLGGREDD